MEENFEFCWWFLVDFVFQLTDLSGNNINLLEMHSPRSGIGPRTFILHCEKCRKFMRGLIILRIVLVTHLFCSTAGLEVWILLSFILEKNYSSKSKLLENLVAAILKFLSLKFSFCCCLLKQEKRIYQTECFQEIFTIEMSFSDYLSLENDYFKKFFENKNDKAWGSFG